MCFVRIVQKTQSVTTQQFNNQVWFGFKPQRQRHMWVEFVIGSPVFPSPQKPTVPNSNSTMIQVDEEPLCGCATVK